jgi:hypothetical protein
VAAPLKAGLAVGGTGGNCSRSHHALPFAFVTLFSFGGLCCSSILCRMMNEFAIEDGLMAILRTLLLATATVVVSTVMVQAAELEIGPRATRAASYYHHRQHLCDSCAFVQGVRGGNPMTVPFFGEGWSNGTTYLAGWQRCTCCAAAEPAVSVRY